MSQPDRRKTSSLVAIALAIVALLSAGSAVVLAATRAVEIADFAFGPASITINVGDRVRWTNADGVAHTATATNGSFDTGEIDQGESATIRFTQPGTYRYLCTPHPTMTGTIRVRAASGATIPPTDAVAASMGATTTDARSVALAVLAAAGLLGTLAIARRRLA